MTHEFIIAVLLIFAALEFWHIVGLRYDLHGERRTVHYLREMRQDHTQERLRLEQDNRWLTRENNRLLQERERDADLYEAQLDELYEHHRKLKGAEHVARVLSWRNG